MITEVDGQITPLGWEAIDSLLKDVQVAHPGAAIEVGEIRGHLAALRYIVGLPIWISDQQERELTVAAAEDLVSAPSRKRPLPVVDMRSLGFTGSFCPDCGGSHMVRSGTCEKCQDCGATTGCS